MALGSGANDFGGTLMEESISRESGSQFGENTSPEDFRRLIREIGRVPVERSTLYGTVQRFDDPALDPKPSSVGEESPSQADIPLDLVS
jgi:2-iminoacetate synthase ThiH